MNQKYRVKLDNCMVGLHVRAYMRIFAKTGHFKAVLWGGLVYEYIYGSSIAMLVSKFPNVCTY